MKKALITALILACNFLSAFGIEAQDKTEYLNLNWWKKFNDEILIDHLLDAYENNHDLKTADINTKEANQIVKMSFAKELPEINFNGRYKRDFESSDIRHGDILIPNYTQSNFTLPLTMTYEFDIWGKNRMKTKSLKLEEKIAKENERGVYISLTSAIAGNYFNLIKADSLIENQKELIEIQKKIVSMEEKKYNAGLCNIVEVIEEKQALTFFESELNSLIEKQDVIKNRLLVLTGRRDGEIKRGILGEIPYVPEFLDVNLIEKRPDIIKTETFINKTRYDVKIAKKDFLPSFLVFGQAGFSAYQLNKIFTPDTLLLNLGISPNLNLFDGGLKKSVLNYKKLEYEKAIQEYEQTILTSIQELNDSLLSAKISKQNYEKMNDNFKFEENVYGLSNKKYNIGAKSLLEHYKAHQALLLAKKEEISTKADCFLSAINIYKATGGVDYTEEKI